ncbi:protocadherin Fat 4-like isoform X3 [Mobula hypostoma]|uniref:protocadherin Fat 4-like isoform X3 n=1 Tax=Mobula hypostoma TaxID=723540 RepID=UPI002FC2CD4A
MNVLLTVVLILQGILKISAVSFSFLSNPVVLAEEEPIGTVVATTSNDFSATEFEIVGGNSYFGIENETGIIKTIVDIDFESSIPKTFLLVIRATNATETGTQTLTISITDVDESPLCTNSAADLVVSISETNNTGETVHIFSASDPESKVLNYSILSISTSGTLTLFEINNLGVISTVSALDYESTRQLKRYDAVVSVSDPAGNTCTDTVTIHITDVNDESPVVSNCPSSPASVDEEAPALTQVVHLTATDNDDNDVLTFSFGTPVPQFQINGTGNDAWIITSSLLDYDDASTINSYQLNVIVTDTANNYAICDFIVSLNPVNEAPECEVQFAAGTGPAVTIPETSATDVSVYKLNASDPDGNDLFYTILSSSSTNTTARFRVDNFGQIYTTSALNFENGDTIFYAVVSVTENMTASLSCTSTVTITVTDVNDETPTISFCPSSTFNLNEETAAHTTLILLSASDNDNNDQSTFSFLGNESAFEIQQAGNTATISNTLQLDYEDDSVVKFYTLSIVVTDLGGNIAMCNLNISLNPINEAPECAANLISGQTVTIAENNDTGVSVYSFSASDPDGDVLNYTILSTSTSGTLTLFAINTVGVIYTVSTLDYEATGQLKLYDAVVSVSDPAGETCTGTVVIHITDVNDEAPIISGCPSSPLLVDEDVPVTTQVLQLSATDNDDNDNFTFSFTTAVSDFRIIQAGNVAWIVTNSLLDYDDASAIKSYQLSVIVSDLASNIAICNLTVNLNPINEAPNCEAQFVAGTGPAVTIPETSALGISVYKLTASDPDEDTLHYTILSASSTNTTARFNVDNLGQITTSTALNFENGDTLFYAVVSINDNATSGLGCTGTVTITVTDVNDESPTISSCPLNTLILNEETAAGSTLITLSAADEDVNDVLAFSFAINETDFEIHTAGHTAQITNTFKMDYENTSAIRFYTLNVVVTDSGGPAVTIPETSALGISVYKLTASDPDEDTLHYTILSTSSTNTTARFNVDNLGQITTSTALNFENGDTLFYAVVSINDNATSGLGCTGTVTITVTDVNDESPTISSCPLNTLILNEETAAGSTLITLSAVDDDVNDVLAFSFAINETDFEIHTAGHTAQITNTFKMDYENTSAIRFYTLNVVVTDSGGNYAICNLNVTLNPINEAPLCDANFEAGSGQTVTIAENNDTGVSVYSFSASDPDGDVLNYTILSTSTSGTLTLFAINTVGVIYTVSTLDYEATGQLKLYDAVVSVSDPAGETCTGTVVIHITDVNDEAPIISGCPSSPLLVDEDVPVTTQVLQLSATDNDDNDNFTFSFTTAVSDFQIIQAGNVVWIVTNSLLDYDDASAVKSYQLSVIVTDLASNIAICNLTVNLNPINEAPNCEAQFVAGTGPAVTIPETSALGISVYKLTASDPDEDTLHYTILSTSSTNTTARFNVDNLGQITTSTALNFENGDTLFYAVVSINDNATSGLGCTGTVTITVTDVNDESPTISSCPLNTLILNEETAAGSTLITLSAVDDDVNDVLAFSFAINETDFEIHTAGHTAQITNTFKMDYENTSAIRFYTLNVVVTDSGGNYAICNLNVTLNPINEAPLCDANFEAGSGLTATIAETSAVGASVYKLTASDPDGDTLHYSLLPSSSTNTTARFHVDDLGLISTATTLNFENGDTVFYAKVSIDDNATTSLSCTGTVTIIVTDVNDEAPTISSCPSSTLNLYEETTTGTTLISLTASDDDTNDNLTFSFEVNEPDFEIHQDGNTAKITNAFKMNYENASAIKFYTLNVVVTDAGDNKARCNLNVTLVNINEAPVCEDALLAGPSITIPETTAIGAPVYKLNVEDPDGNSLQYSLLATSSTNTTARFSVDSLGEISTVAALNYENGDMVFYAVVSISDNVTASLSCTGTVTITVTDVNDETPTISSCPISTLILNEEVAAGKTLITLSASDDDNNDNLTFSFGINVPEFEIHQVSNTATITNSLKLDYDNASTIKLYTLNVVVTDSGLNTATCNLNISLAPINEAPVCDADLVAGPTVTIPETTAVGTLVYKLTASDPDGNSLQYSFLASSSDNTTARFSLDTLGQISTAAALNFENGDMVFYAVVSISDNVTASISCTGTVTITVTDVNDETPTISSCPLSTLILNEEVAAGKTLISLFASDGDNNDNLTFSFAVDEPNFEIHQVSDTAIITNSLKLDYENTSAIRFYTLRTVVTDQSGNIAMCNLNVSLNPVNEAPICDASFEAGTGPSVTIPETAAIGTSVYKLTASDPDGNTLQYSILPNSTPNTTARFNVDNLGLISTASALNFENGDMLFYAVVAINDSATTSLGCTGTVTITVSDVNDESPIFSSCPMSTLFLDEEVPAGTAVITLSASDDDNNENLTFSFAVNESVFEIHQVANTAIITNALKLDYDNDSVVKSYTLNVVITDLQDNTAMCNLDIALLSINEAPICEADFEAGTGPAVTIPETSPAGTSVYKLTASDPDGDSLHYSILPSSSTNTTARFSVDNLGQISTAAALNFENGDTFFYAVVAINDSATTSLGCTGTVTITVTDVNDESPAFSSCPSSNLILSEEVATGTKLTILSASDNDNNDTLTFSFSVNEPDFKIQQVENTAIITNAFKMDYDTASAIRFYTLNIVVKDRAGNTAMCNVNISLIPVNEAPICDADFEAGTASVDINETHDVLTTIYKVVATDPDFEDSLTYEIASQVSGPLTGGNIFSIDSATGIIYRNISTSLDYDSGYHVFTLDVTVKDKGTPSPQKSCKGILTINIIDQNDEVPIMSFSPANPINFTEDSPAGTVVVQLDSTDRDAGDVASYSLAEASQDFSINPVTGIMTAINVLDYDNSTTIKYHSLQVFVTDKALNTATVSLTIVLQPVNEPPVCTSPQLAEGNATMNIDENYPNLKTIYQVTATDPDEGDSLTFSIVSQESSPVMGGNQFSIDADTGIVYRNSTTILDYDHTYHFFTLKIEINDKGNPAPQHSCKGTLTIIVNDLNDEEPVFTPIPLHTIQAQEEVLLGTLIGKVEASDLDENDNILFEFIDNQPLFSLDNDSGDIILQSRLDYDSPDVAQVHFLSIRAFDNNRTHSSTYTLTVSVVNIDEAPNCDPAFTVGAGVSLSIPENFPTSGSVYQILAADPDVNDSVTYSITKETPGTTQYFILDSSTGLLSRTSISPLDYEAGIKRFQMKIVVAEAGKSSPKSCTGSITINLENVNDESPQFMPISPNSLTIDENLPWGTFLIKVNATDEDVDDVIYYEFVKTHTGFLIEEDTGEIKIASLLDYDDINTLTTSILEIRAYDTDQVHSSTSTLTIHIADINDNPPQCSRYLYNMELAETSPRGTPVVSLNCWDNDRTAANNILKYNMVLDSYSTGRFNITGNEITIGSSLLQYDDISFAAVHFQHLIIVKITDNGKPQLTSTATVIVKVTPVNEWNPVSGSRTFNVFEDSPIGALIGTAIFTDNDLPFDNIRYSIVGGNSEIPPMFYIESNSGRIRLLNSLDREKQETYILTVKATDMKNDLQIDPFKQRSSSAIVTVNVLNVNDEAPVCNPEYYESTIYSTITIPFVQLQCSDRDSPDNELSYSIVGENAEDLFELQRPDNNPPQVASTQRFQFDSFQGIEHSKEYTLLIQVTDELGKDKHQQLTSTATVVIHVVPWTTTQPTTTTTTTTTQFTTSVLSITSSYWAPESWFVAVMTLAAALTVLVISGIAWACATRPATLIGYNIPAEV